MPGTYAICRLPAGTPIPGWAQRAGGLLSITLTPDELSIVCRAASVPPEITSDAGWVALKVQGPMPLQMTGVLASLAAPLAEADVPIFAVSTFDTDYLLIKRDDLPVAKSELERFGNVVCLGEKGK